MHRLLISLGCSFGGSFPESTQTVDVGLGGNSGGSRKLVCSTGNFPVCGLAFPDADSKSLDAILHINEHANLEEMLRFRATRRLKPDSGSLTYLSTEWTHILGSLGNFELFDDLSE